MPSSSNIDNGDVLVIIGTSAGALDADLLPEMDVSADDWLDVFIGPDTYSGQLSVQGTAFPSDSSSWQTLQMFQSGSLSIGNIVIDSESNVGYTGPIRFPWLRIRMTDYTSGTATGIIQLKRGARAMSLAGAYATLLESAFSIGNMGMLAYPIGATPLTGRSGNVANASAVATLASSADKTAYITGFEITGSGATAGLPVTVTVVGALGGTMSYTYTATAGVLLANTPLIIEFPSPVPASAVNTDIVVTCPALGAGNTNNTAVAHGYKI